MVAACAIGTSIVFEIFTEEERGQRDGVDTAGRWRGRWTTMTGEVTVVTWQIILSAVSATMDNTMVAAMSIDNK